MRYQSLVVVGVNLCLFGVLARADKVVPADSLPREYVSITATETLSLVTEGTVSVVEVGECLTGTSYRIVVTVQNESGEPLSIKSVSSTCGCIVGVQQNLEIPVKAKAEIYLIISPRESEGEFKKLVKLVDANGKMWPIGVKAFFKLPVSLSPKRLTFSKEEERAEKFELVLTSNRPEVELGSLKVESLSGHLRISPDVTLDRENSRLSIEARLAPDAVSSHLTLIDRVLIRDVSRKAVLGTIDISIAPSSYLVVKPSRIRLQRVDGRYVGTALLIGDRERLSAFKNGSLLLSDGEIRGTVSVQRRAVSLLHLEIVLPLEEKVEGEWRGGEIADQNGQTVSSVERVVLLKGVSEEKGNSDE